VTALDGCPHGTMNTVYKITNLIRGGNRSVNHCNFIKYLEELDCEYGDLLLHTEMYAG
jgi:hypothetical protein